MHVKSAILIVISLLVSVAYSGQRKQSEDPKSKPSLAVKAFTSTSKTVVYCPPEFGSSCPVVSDNRVGLRTTAESLDKESLTYTYSVTGGRIEDEGPSVVWNFDHTALGQHTVTVSVENRKGLRASAALTVNLVVVHATNRLRRVQKSLLSVQGRLTKVRR